MDSPVTALNREPLATRRVAGSNATIGSVYLKVLLILAPIASYIVIPVQGTTPANVLLFASLLVPFFGVNYQVRFLAFIGFFAICYVALLTFSLVGTGISAPDLRKLIEVRRVFISGNLRLTHVTQGIYLLSVVIFVYHIRQKFSQKILNWAYYGIIIFVIYGFYQFIFFAIFGTSGDFIANRNFGDFDITDSQGDGTQLQQSILLGSRFIRFYSLTGEPSMFALTATPFFVFAFAMRSWKIALFLFVALFLSNSTTAIIGMAVGLFVLYCRNSRYIMFGIPAVILLFALFYFTSESVSTVADKLVFDKLSTGSGQERSQSMIDHAAAVFDGNLFRFFFGIGFGTIRSPDLLSTLLANSGIVGLGLYSAVMLAPVFLLPKSPVKIGLQAVLWSIWVMEMLSVSEYAYLPPWFFVAMAYWHCQSPATAQLAPRNSAPRARRLPV